MIVGVDGYKGRRWIVAAELSRGRIRVELVKSFDDLVQRQDFSLVVIDVPIGLLDTGFRGCDKAARSMVGDRRSSVFPAPIRPMLDATSYEDACRRRHEVEGKKCSRQLYAILPLIREVDSRVMPESQDRIREGHPEVSFTALNDGSPMRYNKRTKQGHDERLALLAHHFPDIRRNTSGFGRTGAVTGIVDAYALLWTARRVREGSFKTLPEHPQYDPKGLRAEIVA